MASWKSCGKLADELFYRASDITCWNPRQFVLAIDFHARGNFKAKEKGIFYICKYFYKKKEK